MASQKASYVSIRAGLIMLLLCAAALVVSAFSFHAAEKPLIIAHRGASGYAPENTMAAFELAERLGADFIELDVRMSKDGELAVIHDKTLDRTTNKAGFVHHYTLRELQGIDAGSRFHPVFSEQTIVSLEEVMDRFAGRIGLLIEIKNPPLYPGIEEKVAEVIRRYEPAQGIAGTSIIIQSFDFKSMRRMHSLLPDIPIAVLVHANQHPLTDKTLDELASYASYINYSHDVLDERTVRGIHARSRKVMAWTVRNIHDMERVQQLGVEGIITDYPG